MQFQQIVLHCLAVVGPETFTRTGLLNQLPEFRPLGHANYRPAGAEIFIRLRCNIALGYKQQCIRACLMTKCASVIGIREKFHDPVKTEFGYHIVKVIEGVQGKDKLVIDFKPSDLAPNSKAILSGIEIISDDLEIVTSELKQ